MPQDASGPIDEVERDIALGKLYTRARRLLSRGQVELAAEVVAEVVELAPGTTSAEELLGDVAMARGDYEQARDHYLRATEIEPANADAERKYGEAVLEVARRQRLRHRVEEVAEDPDSYQRSRKIPWIAAFYSIIPGLGQIYNRRYEKGLALIASALILLSWVLSQLISYYSAGLVVSAGHSHGKLDTERAREVVAAWGPLTWALVVLAVIAYLGIWVYSILDAYHTCVQDTREEDQLGVDL
ncbi:MAG: tetratricopeptide repeat protein [Armatimonadetes bacterium]|nr:tetratricopeptide repeat protein [Armatimonadota bacterium]